MSENSHLDDAVWKLYYDREDDLVFSELIKQTTQLSKFTNVQILPIPNTPAGKAQLPTSFQKILFFANPDLTITYSDNTSSEHVVFACEVTKAEAAGDHWMQRFPSIIGPCMSGIPSAAVLAFDSGFGSVGSDFFYAVKRAIDLHKSPLCLIEWQTAHGKILSEDKEFTKCPDRNSQPMIELINFINLIIDYTINEKNLNDLIKEKIYQKFYDDIASKITRTPSPSNDRRLLALNSDGVVNTPEVIRWLNQKVGINFIEKPYMRKKNLIWTPYYQTEYYDKTKPVRTKEALAKRIHEKDGDPYSGMPLALDYLYCRTGVSKHDRDYNLILNLSHELDYDEFMKYFRTHHDKSPIPLPFPKVLDEIPRLSIHLTNPSIPEQKTVIRNWCNLADIIVLKDCIIPFHHDFHESPKFRFTEGNISSITRRFFQKNGFSVISQSKSLKDIHIQKNVSNPPKMKAPDIICFKESTIVVGEQKIKHDQLFTGESSDVVKLDSFLNNQTAKTEFLKLMNEFGNQFNHESIVGGFSSLSNSKSKYKVDDDKIQTVIDIDGTKCTIKLVNDGGVPELFTHKSIDMEI
jgi:hypothetical protein